jgi:hypothetical protein
VSAAQVVVDLLLAFAVLDLSRRTRRPKVTRTEPIVDTEPGHVYVDSNGGEWVSLQRTYDSNGTLSVTFARGGSEADPRIRWRAGT